MAGAKPRPAEAGSSGPVFIAPLRNFLHTEAAGGVVLVVATVVALVWANSPWKDSYLDLWHTHLTISLGSHSIDMDLQEWVNDALMVIFFFVVGLEIKRELVEGELRDPRRAALPAIAAVGGMVVPALIYVAINAGGDGARGWGIPMATDIAMAVGVVSLLGRRVAPSLKLFLLALAIVDDIGAILVIAVFYSHGIHLDAVLLAAALVALIIVMRRAGIRAIPAYVVVGGALWLALFESGLHATLDGVILGLLAPTRPVRRRELIDETALADLSTVTAARETTRLARESVSVVEWLEHLLHPWTSFVIVPLFALANAGIPLSSDTLSAAASSRITYGVVVGLVVGKLIGVSGFAWLATRLRIGVLPDGAGWRGILGVAAVAGIGFTVSIFVAGLAFDTIALQYEAKVGILAASVLAAILGSVILVRSVPPGDGAEARAAPATATAAPLPR
jgi:Na+:H+ antiporter, NhaA family